MQWEVYGNDGHELKSGWDVVGSIIFIQVSILLTKLSMQMCSPACRRSGLIGHTRNRDINSLFEVRDSSCDLNSEMYVGSGQKKAKRH